MTTVVIPQTPPCDVPTTSSRGIFVAFEGLDRSGKSTQAGMLSDILGLAGFDVEFMKFPDRETVSGQRLHEYLQRKQENIQDEDNDAMNVHLLFSENRWEAKERIETKLLSDVMVVCDRYVFSGIAYSAAKGLDRTWCMDSEVGLPVPDCVIFLDIDPQCAAERDGYGDERYENDSFQEKVLEEYRMLHTEHGEGSSWHVLDATRPVQELHEAIVNIVSQAIVDLAYEPIDYF